MGEWKVNSVDSSGSQLLVVEFREALLTAQPAKAATRIGRGFDGKGNDKIVIAEYWILEGRI